MAAGIRTLELLQKPGVYESLEAKAAKLEAGLQDAFDSAETPLTINRVGSMMTAFLNPGEVTGWPSVAKSDRQGFARFFHAMMDRGVYLPPSAFEAMFVSTAHSEDDLDETISAAKDAMEG
jgi:glutamate-1-semialdehyde 2,1-aminomutase